LVDLVRRTAARLEAPSLEMLSQAGHDACYVSRVAPTAMIFTPCERGISHNGRESRTLDDCVSGANVLLGIARNMTGVLVWRIVARRPISADAAAEEVRHDERRDGRSAYRLARRLGGLDRGPGRGPTRARS
jgi:Peptidase family M20/M25/M40